MSDPSLDIDMLIVAGVAGLMSMGAWISTTRARREQSKFNREKAEEEAFIRVQTMYIKSIENLEDQLKIANDRIAEQNKKIHDLETRNENLERRLSE